MKRFLLCVCALLAVRLTALDLENGFSIGGGVKTGVMVKNSDYTGKLGTLSHGGAYPMTLYFASQDNEAYKGEGWLDFGYRAEDWGVRLSFWAHGDLENYNDAVHLGDHYLWANFFDGKLRFIGGQGGGTPISSGGWINAEWLGYTGLRVFWVDPLGFQIGVNFVDPDNGSRAEGINPVNYFSTVMFGAGFNSGNFFISLVFDNNPVYDDTKANYDGGLHRDPAEKPISQKGNIAFGAGLKDFLAGKGLVVLDGIVTNIGADDAAGTGSKSYKISPIETAAALKFAYPLIEKAHTEVKAKLTLKQGDNADDTASTTWGKFEIEPYMNYQIIDKLKAELAVNYTAYINSYYLAESPSVGKDIDKGWAPPYSYALDYYSQFQLFLKPAFIFEYKGTKIIMGYNGTISRDHVENSLFIDFRWAF